MQHGSEPPRAKLGQTWFIDDEAHLLQSRVIVNSNSSKNRYSGTIPSIQLMNRSMPFFSIIIPTFNRIELLPRTVESVLAQWFTDYEIIVVDDGSTDGTLDYLRSLENQVNVLNQPNLGPGVARNLGVRHAKGHYLAFLDSDDLLFPWTLEVYREVVYRENCPSVIAGKPHRFWSESELVGLSKGPIRIQHFPDYLASGEQWRWWGASSFVIQREAFLAVGGFTEEWVNGEDGDLMLRMGVAPCFAQITDPATFAYREHAASLAKDLKRTVADAWVKVRSEQTGRYPGGATRAAERRRILTRHIRPVTFSCLQQGLRREAWGLYRATFVWNAGLGRWKYLTGFPLVMLRTALIRSQAHSEVPG
jgi:Glycosyl transferase family 2